MARIRVAAVGLGWVALNRHLPALDRSAAFEITGVVDGSNDRARIVAQARGYAHHSQSKRLKDIDWINEVDAVTISTPPMGRHALILEALSLRKHVLTEKPFAMTVAEGQSLVDAAEANSCCLAIVHNFQFARSMKMLLRDVEQGQLGRLTGLDAIQLGNHKRRLPVWFEQLRLGLFYDESPHLLYLLQRIAGDLRVSKSLIVPDPSGHATPDRVEVWFRSDSFEAPIRMSCNFQSPVSEWYLMVFGERRLGIVDIFRDIYLSLPNDGSHGLWSVLRTSLVATSQHWMQHITNSIPYMRGRLSYGNDEVFERFSRGIAGDEACLRPINSSQALSILKLQHKIIESGQQV